MTHVDVLLPEVSVDPLGDIILDFLIERDREEAFLDFKETLSIAKDAPFAKISKDILAFANYGGGFILLGFKEKSKSRIIGGEMDEKRSFLPIGLPDEFHIDQADLQAKFNSYVNSPIQIQYREFERNIDGTPKKFAAIYVPASAGILRPLRSGFYKDEKGKKHAAFKAGVVLFRRGTQSIVASKEEIAWITRRAEREGYRLSILSGEPDRIHEVLYANLFEVIKIPEVIWVALPNQDKCAQHYQSTNAHYTAVYVFWNNRIVTFDDISRSESPLWSMIDPNSVQLEELSAWLADDDKQRVVIQLLNKELRFLANRLGLLHEYKKQKFYYPCVEEYRTEKWTPRFRASSILKVAQRMWAQQLNGFVFWHLAVIARFAYLQNRLFLKLKPTLQLTDDGRNAIFGPKEGTVITRLIYNRYNASYLNSLLFWISRIAEGKDNIALANGKIIISAIPAKSEIGVGVLSDRPTFEPIEDTPEIQIEEKK